MTIVEKIQRGANSRKLNFNSSNANMNSNNLANGNYVRCLKDYISRYSAASLGSFSMLFKQMGL